MLTKIVFTLLVMVVVALVFRNKHSGRTAPEQTVSIEPGAFSTRAVAYGILGILVTISITVFIFSYHSDNRIVTIRVIAEDGISTIYQARQKFIKGRQFVTLDGTRVTLGQSDRIEKEDQ